MPEGGNIGDYESQAKKVKGVVPNRVDIVAPTSLEMAETAKTDGGKLIDASSMEAVVSKCGPKVKVELAVNGEDSPVECEMAYGADNPKKVVADFDDGHLLVKVRTCSPKHENELKNRPLLNQRVGSLVAKELVKLCDDKRVKKAMASEAGIKAMVSEIEGMLQNIAKKRTEVQASDQLS